MTRVTKGKAVSLQAKLKKIIIECGGVEHTTTSDNFRFESFNNITDSEDDRFPDIKTYVRVEGCPGCGRIHEIEVE